MVAPNLGSVPCRLSCLRRWGRVAAPSQIVSNAGKEGAVIVERVRAEKNPNIGYNAVTERFEDLVAAGVIDPTKVTRCALQNAASIAGLLLTTEALISELQDDKPRATPGGMDM